MEMQPSADSQPESHDDSPVTLSSPSDDTVSFASSYYESFDFSRFRKSKRPTPVAPVVDHENVDNVDKILRTYRRYKSHLVRVFTDDEISLVEQLDLAFFNVTIWEEAIRGRASLLSFVKELKAMSFQIGNWELPAESESFEEASSSSSFGTSSFKDSYVVPEVVRVEARLSDLEFPSTDKPPSPPVSPVDEALVDIPWGYCSPRDPNESTDSLYEVDLSSDATPPVGLKRSALRKKYHKTRGWLKADKPLVCHLPDIGEDELVTTRHHSQPVKVALDNLRRQSCKCILDKHEKLVESVRKPSISYEKRQENGRRVRWELWKRQLKPIIERASEELDKLEPLIDEEEGKDDACCHYEENLALQSRVSRAISNAKSTAMSPSSSLLSVAKKPAVVQTTTLPVEKKPYHLVCRDRLRTTNRSEQLFLDNVRQLALTNTYAVAGLNFEKILLRPPFLADEEFYDQFKMSRTEKRRLARIMRD